MLDHECGLPNLVEPLRSLVKTCHENQKSDLVDIVRYPRAGQPERHPYSAWPPTVGGRPTRVTPPKVAYRQRRSSMNPRDLGPATLTAGRDAIQK
jgi:hypothetical protein